MLFFFLHLVHQSYHIYPPLSQLKICIFSSYHIAAKNDICTPPSKTAINAVAFVGERVSVRVGVTLC